MRNWKRSSRELVEKQYAKTTRMTGEPHLVDFLGLYLLLHPWPHLS